MSDKKILLTLQLLNTQFQQATKESLNTFEQLKGSILNTSSTLGNVDKGFKSLSLTIGNINDLTKTSENAFKQYTLSIQNSNNIVSNSYKDSIESKIRQDLDYLQKKKKLDLDEIDNDLRKVKEQKRIKQQEVEEFLKSEKSKLDAILKTEKESLKSLLKADIKSADKNNPQLSQLQIKLAQEQYKIATEELQKYYNTERQKLNESYNNKKEINNKNFQELIKTLNDEKSAIIDRYKKEIDSQKQANQSILDAEKEASNKRKQILEQEKQDKINANKLLTQIQKNNNDIVANAEKEASNKRKQFAKEVNEYIKKEMESMYRTSILLQEQEHKKKLEFAKQIRDQVNQTGNNFYNSAINNQKNNSKSQSETVKAPIIDLEKQINSLRLQKNQIDNNINALIGLKNSVKSNTDESNRYKQSLDLEIQRLKTDKNAISENITELNKRKLALQQNIDTTKLSNKAFQEQFNNLSKLKDIINQSTQAINNKTTSTHNLINSSQILNRIFSGLLYQSIYKIQQIISQATDDIKKFESTIYEIKQIEGNNVGGFNDIAKNSLKLANDLKISSTLIAEAMRIGLASGLEYGDELETIVSQSAIFAKATNTDIKDVINMAILLKNNFKIASKDIGIALNQVGISARESKLDLKDYVAQIGGLASSAMLSNIPLREQLTLFSLFGNKLRNASESAVAVKNLFAKIENPTKNMEKWADLAQSKGINIKFGAEALKDAKTMEAFLSNFAKGIQQIKNNKDILADMFGDQRAKKGLVQALASMLPSEEITKKYPEIAKALGKSVISEFEKIKYEILNDTEYINQAYQISFKSLESRSTVAIDTIQNSFKKFFIDHEKDIHRLINNMEGFFNSILPYLEDLKPLIRDIFSQFSWINSDDGLKIALKSIAWFVSSAIGIFSSWANATASIVSFRDTILNGFVVALVKMTQIVAKYGKALLNPFDSKARNEALKDLDIALSDQGDLVKKHYDNMIKQVERLGKKVIDSGKAFGKIRDKTSSNFFDTRNAPKTKKEDPNKKKKDFSSPNLFGDGTIDLIGNPQLDEAKSIIERLQNSDSSSVSSIIKESQKIQKKYEAQIGYLKQTLQNKKITQKQYDEELKVYTQAFNLQMLELAKKQKNELNKIDEARFKKINDEAQKGIDEQNKLLKDKYDKEDAILQQSLELADEVSRKRQSNIEKLAITEYQTELEIINNQIWADKEKVKSLNNLLKNESLSSKERKKLSLDIEDTKNKIEINGIKQKDLLLDKEWEKNKARGESDLALFQSNLNDKLELGKKANEYEKALEDDIINDKQTSLDFILELRQQDLNNAKNTYGENSQEYIKANRVIKDITEKQIQNVNTLYSTLAQNTGLLSEQGTNFLNTLSKDFDLSTGKMIDNAQGLSGALKAVQKDGFKGLTDFAKNGGDLSGLLGILNLITDSAGKMFDAFKNNTRKVNDFKDMLEASKDIFADIGNAVTLGFSNKIRSFLGQDVRSYSERNQSIKQLELELNKLLIDNAGSKSEKLIEIAKLEYDSKYEIINKELISFEEKNLKKEILELEFSQKLIKITQDTANEIFNINQQLDVANMGIQKASYDNRYKQLEQKLQSDYNNLANKYNPNDDSAYIPSEAHLKSKELAYQNFLNDTELLNREFAKKSFDISLNLEKSKIELTQDSIQKELKLEELSYEEKKAKADFDVQEGLVREEDKNALLETIENEHQANINKIKEKSNQEIQKYNEKAYNEELRLIESTLGKKRKALESEYDQQLDIIEKYEDKKLKLQESRKQTQEAKIQRKNLFNQRLSVIGNLSPSELRKNEEDFNTGGFNANQTQIDSINKAFDLGDINLEEKHRQLTDLYIKRYQYYNNLVKSAVGTLDKQRFTKEADNAREKAQEYILDTEDQKLDLEKQNAEKSLNILKDKIDRAREEEEKQIKKLDEAYKTSAGVFKSELVQATDYFVDYTKRSIETIGADLFNQVQKSFIELDKAKKELLGINTSNTQDSTVNIPIKPYVPNTQGVQFGNNWQNELNAMNNQQPSSINDTQIPGASNYSTGGNVGPLLPDGAFYSQDSTFNSTNSLLTDNVKINQLLSRLVKVNDFNDNNSFDNYINNPLSWFEEQAKKYNIVAPYQFQLNASGGITTPNKINIVGEKEPEMILNSLQATSVYGKQMKMQEMFKAILNAPEIEDTPLMRMNKYINEITRGNNVSNNNSSSIRIDNLNFSIISQASNSDELMRDVKSYINSGLRNDLIRSLGKN